MDKKIEELHGLMKKLREELDKKDDTIGEVSEKVHNIQDAIDELEGKLEKETDFQKKLTARLPFAFGEQGRQEEGPSENRKTFIGFMRKGVKSIGPEGRKALTVADDEGGGYLVPEEYRQELIQSLPDNSVMRQYARVINTSRESVRIPTVDGSMSWYWTDEQSLPAESDETTGQLVIPTHTATGLIKVSQQLLEDSVFDIEAFIEEEFQDSLGLKEDNVFLVGDGQSKPEGILTNADILANRVITSSTASSMDVDDIIDLEYSIDEKYASNAGFMCRRKIVRELRKLKDTNDNYYYGSPASAGEPATFDGYPIYKPSTGMDEAIGDGNMPIMFGDYSYYWIVDRVDMSVQRLTEKYAPQVGLLFRVRRGGKVVLPEAFSVLKIKSA